MSNDGTAIYSEKRRARRVPTPGGTNALVKGKNSSLDTVIVRDISVIGMLICGNNKKEEFSTNSFIDDIYINFPLGRPTNGTKSFIFIDRGKIVRSFTDETSKTLCYGVEFIYDSPYVKEQIEKVMNLISPDSNS